jgi:hypothetical protein
VGNLFLKTNYPQETKELANEGNRSCVKPVRYVVKMHRHARRPREMRRNMSVVDVIIGGTGYNFKRNTGNEIKREAPSNV